MRLQAASIAFKIIMTTADSFPIAPFETPAMGLITRPVQGEIPGRIRYGGTTWFAQPYINGLGLTFGEGEMTLILARKGNTMLIMPMTE